MTPNPLLDRLLELHGKMSRREYLTENEWSELESLKSQLESKLAQSVEEFAESRGIEGVIKYKDVFYISTCAADLETAEQDKATFDYAQIIELQQGLEKWNANQKTDEDRRIISQYANLVKAVQDVIDNHAGQHIPYMMERLKKAIERAKA